MPSDSSDANSKKPTHLIVPVFAYFGNSWKLYKFETLHNFPRPSPSKKKVRKKSFSLLTFYKTNPIVISSQLEILIQYCSLCAASVELEAAAL